ncbi:MAG: acetoacetate--CoA ligase [Chlamydiae bacterium]|nr:acetoacetate--CoA ligase [Chlamydiota bacterium]
MSLRHLVLFLCISLWGMILTADEKLPSSRPQPAILWQPSAEHLASTNLAEYVGWLGRERGLHFDLADYRALQSWSSSEIEQFWSSIWDYFDLQADGDPSVALVDRAMPGTDWFPNTSLNFAEQIFRGKDRDALAIVVQSELRPMREVTWGELRNQTAAIAAGMERLGIGPGDRVAAYLPNSSEAIAAFLAAASIGAIWSSCSPEFGAESVVERFSQIKPKLLLTVDGYSYKGRRFDRMGEVAKIEVALPTVEHTIVLSYLEESPELASLRSGLSWGEAFEPAAEPLSFRRMPFSHPLWIVYSSGTTGMPKPIVHGHGGILLEHLKTGWLHLDAREGDRFFFYTTTGWVFWNSLVGLLLTDAAIVLYDGSPVWPEPDSLWQIADEAGVTCLGTGAAYLVSCMRKGVVPRTAKRPLSQLRSICSTGSPLPPEGFRWVNEQFGNELWLTSFSGGTDVCTAFVGGCPLLPVYEGELQAAWLGVSLKAFDEAGESLIGEVGELVITEPLPSMPVSFWGDDDGSRLRESYFELYPGLWRHGDWIEITERGSAIIYGRSDSTLNRGGVRIGTSEIYRSVLREAGIADALVVDLPSDVSGAESSILLFVVLGEGVDLDEAMVERIRGDLRKTCSPRPVPDQVIAVPIVPRTISGKLLEVPVKRILLGADPEKVASRGSLADPDSLDWFIAFHRRREP